MEACLNCVTKHVSQAMIIHEEEVPLGYPEHIKRVIGHLAEASRECVAQYPDMAAALREHRLRAMDDPDYVPPYMGILAYVDLLVECDNQDITIPEFPEDLKKPAPEPA